MKALRWYDEVGLLRPVRVDPRSGYRFYAPEQFGAAERIRALRETDMPLGEIAALLGARDAAERLTVLRRQRDRLERDLAERRQALDLLLKLMSPEEDRMNEQIAQTVARNIHDSFAVETVPARPVVYIRERVSLATVGDAMKGAFGELYAWLERAGVSPAGPALCAYPDPEFDEDDFLADACVPVAALPNAAALTGRVRADELAGGRVATAVHAGPYDTLHLAFQRALAEAAERGHEIVGPPREIYLVSWGDARAPEEFRTRIEYPVRG